MRTGITTLSTIATTTLVYPASLILRWSNVIVLHALLSIQLTANPLETSRKLFPMYFRPLGLTRRGGGHLSPLHQSGRRPSRRDGRDNVPTAIETNQ